MFEQSYYNQEPAEPAKEGEFLYGYEVRSWELTPRLYKIIAASAAANILALLIFGQASFLTAKGCDNPLVGRVCQVLDTVYVGSLLFGTDREYVDVAYDKTNLDDVDVTFVDVSGMTPPLDYPPGYFQLANPEQQFPAPDQASLNSGFIAPGIPNNPSFNSPGLINTPQVIPQPNPDVVQGQLPTFGDNRPPLNRKGPKRPPLAGNSAVGINDNTNTTGNPTVDPNATANANATTTPPEDEIALNKKPLEDFANLVLAKWTNKQVDLNQQFIVSLNATLTKEGKFDPKKSKWDMTKEKGDPKMIEIAKEAVEAVGDSGFLMYLRNLDVDKANIVLMQDDGQITAVITSSQRSVARAQTVTSGMNSLISLGKARLKDPSDELTLLNGAAVEQDGSNIVLKFVIPKPIAQEMIERKLKEAQAKQQQQPTPSGNAVTKSNDNAAK